jgi:hypothetical protein
MDRIWKLPKKSIAEQDFYQAATTVAAGYEGVELSSEREAKDCLSFFFTLPLAAGATIEVELSIYDLGGEGVVLSLEPDAAENNQYWDEASQLAEELADELQADSVVI